MVPNVTQELSIGRSLLRHLALEIEGKARDSCSWQTRVHMGNGWLPNVSQGICFSMLQDHDA